MYLNAGHLHNCKLPYKDKSKPLIVCSCGTYRLINKEKLPTWRPKGRLDFQLVYIAAGKARFFFGKDVMDIPAGHMILFQPRQEQHYEYYAEDKPEVFWLHFTGSDVKNILRSYNIPLDERYFYTGVTSIYQQLFTGMIQELQNCRIGYEELLEMYLRQLLLMVQRYRQDPKSSICPLHQEEIDLARRYFHAHYNEEINIEQYAQAIHMSPCWFNRTFKATTGCTPTQYITDIRMKVAAQLLVTTHDSIQEIASLVGYDNPYYFSRIFRRATGVSPSSHRKSNLHLHSSEEKHCSSQP